MPAITFVTFTLFGPAHCNSIAIPPTDHFVENLIFYLIVQLNLIFGVAGLMWPDKIMPVFVLLMFPWPASHRAIRTHGIIASLAMCW